MILEEVFEIVVYFVDDFVVKLCENVKEIKVEMFE